MKKSVSFINAAVILLGITACNGGDKKSRDIPIDEPLAEIVIPEYQLLHLPIVDLLSFEKDADGWITIFDGESFHGWRGYNKMIVPSAWTIDNHSIKISGDDRGEDQDLNGGDLIFAHKLSNFEFEFEWKVAKGANSGVLIYIQEVDGQPSYISAPEYQIIDNENHPDAKLGKNGNRMSASLYDMIPAKTPNTKPYGEWNKGKISCFKGTVAHYQNEESVLEYHLWTSQWKELLDKSRFSKDKWPLAYELLMNCGGNDQEGFIGLQDQGDDVWFRNMRVKILN